jgi:putative ABC transport system permease protein
VMAAIEQALSGRASVRHAAARDAWADSALLLVRTIVAALLVVAILVASLVSFSALSLFVDRRIPELALLQVAGLEPRRVRRILYLDAALLALLGTGAGALLGRVFAAGFLGGLSWVSDFLQGIELSRIDFNASTAATALGVGGLVSFAGVLEPARRATRQAPLDALLGLATAGGLAETWSRRAWLAAALAAAAGLSAVVVDLPPLARVVAILTAGLALLGVVIRSGLPPLLRGAGRVLDIVLPGIGRLAGASLAARPGETALAAVCVAGVVSGVTISLVLAESTARTIDTWMQSQFPGGVFVTAGPIAAIEPEEFISADTLRIIRETPGVRGVFDQVVEKIDYRGEQVLLFGGRMDVMARFGRLAVVHGDSREIAEAVADGALVVSDRFAQHFGVAAGDTITLDTPKVPRSFRVAGVNRDYSGPAGSINIESSVFDALWPRRGSRDLVLWTEGDPAPVISEIRRRVGEAQTLFFAYGDDLAHFASRLLRRFQIIVMSVALLTAVLGGIAIWNVMLGAVTARRRELALLLATGATQRQIRALTLIDALLLAACGGVGGIVLGVCSGYPVVSSVMADAVGWSLSFSVAPGDLLMLMAGLLCAALLASLYPARLAARVPMREVSGAE